MASAQVQNNMTNDANDLIYSHVYEYLRLFEQTHTREGMS